MTRGSTTLCTNGLALPCDFLFAWRLNPSRGCLLSFFLFCPGLLLQNTDAGTMSPFEHGEVFVLDDGGEADLDLGNYERFLGVRLSRDHNITTGKVYLIHKFSAVERVSR